MSLINSKLKYIFILMVGSFVSKTVQSQINYQIWINEAWNTTPLLSTNFTIDGSPFIPDRFYKATVFLKDGKFLAKKFDTTLEKNLIKAKNGGIILIAKAFKPKNLNEI